MRQRREAKNASPFDGTHRASNEACKDSCGDFENVRVQIRLRCNDELQYTKQTTEKESYRQINETRPESKWTDGSARKTVHQDEKPGRVLLFPFYDFVEPLGRFFNPDDVMHYLLVDFMSVPELAQIDALCASYEPDFGGMCGGIVKGNNHTSWQI